MVKSDCSLKPSAQERPEVCLLRLDDVLKVTYVVLQHKCQQMELQKIIGVLDVFMQRCAG